MLPSLEKPTPASSAAVAFPTVLLSRPADRRLFSSRLARSAFGLALVVTGFGLAVDAAAGFPLDATAMIAGGWLCAVSLAGAVFVASFAWTQMFEIGRLDDRYLAASLALPVAGLALTLPLTLHAAVFASDTHGFDSWVAMSLVIVGHCHVALAVMGAWRMVRLTRGENAMPPWAIYGIVVGLAMVPGALFLMIPPLLVAFTGLAFVFILWAPSRIIAKERAVLAEA